MHNMNAIFFLVEDWTYKINDMLSMFSKNV